MQQHLQDAVVVLYWVSSSDLAMHYVITTTIYELLLLRLRLPPLAASVSQQGTRFGQAHRLLGETVPDAVQARLCGLPLDLRGRRHQGAQRGQADARRQELASAIGQQF